MIHKNGTWFPLRFVRRSRTQEEVVRDHHLLAVVNAPQHDHHLVVHLNVHRLAVHLNVHHLAVHLNVRHLVVHLNVRHLVHPVDLLNDLHLHDVHLHDVPLSDLHLVHRVVPLNDRPPVHLDALPVVVHQLVDIPDLPSPLALVVPIIVEIIMALEITIVANLLLLLLHRRQVVNLDQRIVIPSMISMRFILGQG